MWGWIIAAYLFGCIVGFLLCAFMATAKYADLERENARLRDGKNNLRP